MAEYGQFGQAVYDQNVKEWHFERDLKAVELRQIGDSRTVVPPAIVPYAERQHGARQREKQIQTLVQSYPELQPAASLLPDFDRVSKAVEDATSRYDPMKGDLLAFGSIADAGDGEPVEIAAFVTGPTGSDIRVVRLKRKAHTLDDLNSMRVPSIVDEGASWKGPGVAIQSINFAQQMTGSNGTILAVRLVKEIVFFRTRMSKATTTKLPTIELNQFVRVGIEEVENLPFSHVAFNPWNIQQFAIIDQAACWAVFEMNEGRAGVSASLIHRVNFEDAAENEQRTPKDDGWVRISWVTAPTVLVVGNRRSLTICDYQNSATKDLPPIATVLNDTLGWNLDVAMASAFPNRIIVLTTSHVVVYRIFQNEEDGLDADCVMCTRHFLNGSDLSLRLHVCQDDDEVLIFIRSDLTPTVIYYRLDTSTPDHITCSDPMRLNTPSFPFAKTEESRIIGMHFRSLPQSMSLDPQLGHPLLHATKRGDGLFYLLTTLHQDMSVREHLYVSGPRVLLSQIELGDSSRINTADLAASLNGLPSRDSISKSGQNRVAEHPATKSSNDWTISYELTTRQLNDPSRPLASETNDFFETVLAEVIGADAYAGTLNETLQEQFAGEVELDDIQAVTNALNALQKSLQLNAHTREESIEPFDGPARPRRPVLGSVDWPPTLRGDDPLDLAPLHLSIVDNWIAPLPEAIPKAVWAVQEQHAMRVATEVGLSRVVIRFRQHQETSAPQQGRHVEFNLPVRASGAPGSSRVTPSVYFDASSQPSSSARSTPSSPGAASSIASHDQPRAVTGLSRYTSFSNPPSTDLPRSMNRVLSHWTLGADPTEYDWRNTTRRVDRQAQEEENEELTEKDRIRQQRRKERHERRRQRHEEERHRQEMLHSQAPEILESQPTQGSTSYGFSQGPAGSQIFASQILPGRYGGRPPPKKKRKSGF